MNSTSNTGNTKPVTREGAIEKMQRKLETLRSSNAALQDELKRCRRHNAHLQTKLDRYRTQNAALKLKLGISQAFNAESTADLKLSASEWTLPRESKEQHNTDSCVEVPATPTGTGPRKSPVTVVDLPEDIFWHGSSSGNDHQDVSAFRAKRKHDEMASAENLIHHCAFMM